MASQAKRVAQGRNLGTADRRPVQQANVVEQAASAVTMALEPGDAGKIDQIAAMRAEEIRVSQPLFRFRDRPGTEEPVVAAIGIGVVTLRLQRGDFGGIDELRMAPTFHRNAHRLRWCGACCVAERLWHRRGRWGRGRGSALRGDADRIGG